MDAVEQLGVGAPIRLRNGYTILNVPESRIEELAALPQVEYIEKPKKLYFDVENGIAASCILPVQRRDSFLLCLCMRSLRLCYPVSGNT